MSRFEKFQNKQVLSEKGKPLDGQIYLHDCIVNFEDGFISNLDHEAEGENDSPAISCIDAYIEYWEKGVLHKDDGPAVYSVDGFEFWKNGVIDKNPSTSDDDEYEENDQKESTDKKSKELRDYFLRKGREAELAFANYLDKEGITFIHLNQTKGALYSNELRKKGIKRPDYIVIIDKEPYFIEVKATGVYTINEEELKRLNALEEQSSINVIFAVTDINKEKFVDYNFMTLDTLNKYIAIIAENKNVNNWFFYPYSKLLLKDKVIPNDINNDELEKIYNDENHIEIDKCHYSDILSKYLKDNNYTVK